MATTKTKPRSTAKYFHNGHQWTPAELTRLTKAVVKAESAGQTKRSVFEAVAQKMQAKDPSMSLTKVEARYNWHRRTLKGKAEIESLGGIPTARQRPAVQRAAETLTKTASPEAIKPRAKAASKPKAIKAPSVSPITLIGQLEAYVSELEAKKAAAERRADKAEAEAEKAQKKLSYLHKITA